MKRFWTVLLAVAVALVMALPAGAVKPDCRTYPEGHPQACPEDPTDPPPDEPLVGLTCAGAFAEGYDFFLVGASEGEPFTVTVGNREEVCIDVASIAGTWMVEVARDGMGSALEIQVGLQDSMAPGDACWGACAGGGVFTEPGTYYFYDTPASAINACDFDVMDPDFDDGDDRLVFRFSASYRGDPKNITDAEITVTPPPS